MATYVTRDNKIQSRPFEAEDKDNTGVEDVPLTNVIKSVGTLKSLSINRLAITDVEQLAVDSSGNDYYPFDVNFREKIAYLPSNYQNILSNESYIYFLWSVIAERDGYKFVILEKDFVPKYLKDAKTEKVIQAFGIPILNKRLEECPKSKGFIRRGFYHFMFHMVTGMKGVGLDLFKCSDAKSLYSSLFDPKDKKFSVEKKILDYIINYLRRTEIDLTHIGTYIKPYHVLVKEQGLSTNLHKSKALSETEISLCDLYIGDEKNDFYLPNKQLSSLGDLMDLVKNITKVRKNLRTYRTVLKDITSKRVSSVYGQYKTKREKISIKGKSFSNLVQSIEDKSILANFNPSKIWRLFGMPYIHFDTSVNDGPRKYIMDAKRVCDDLIDRGIIDTNVYTLAITSSEGFAAAMQETMDE